jgi:large subunit ribosomal protein L24
MTARLRTGDTVIVISGKDKGKTGKLLAVMADDAKVIVEGLNIQKRHTKPSPKNQDGGIFEKAMPLHSCKVMPIDPKTGKGTRVKVKTDAKGNKVRIAKSGETIANVVRAKNANTAVEAG